MARLSFEQIAEIERLERLRHDVDSALGRLMTYYVKAAVGVPPDVAEGWMRRATAVEDMRAAALNDLAAWVDEAARG